MIYALFLGLIIGFFLGVLAVVTYGTYKVNQLERIKKKAAEDFKAAVEEAEKQHAGWKERMSQVMDMTKMQIELRSRAEEPSKNALHSKYKNDIVQEIKLLEEEKVAILRSILKDGHDPVVTIDTAEGRKKVKLSEYFVSAGIKVNDGNMPATDPENESGIRQVGKFTVYPGGNDGTTH